MSSAANPVSGFVPSGPYLELPRSPETWIVKNLLPAGGFLNIYGQPKYGKSFAALQMAQAIAGGDPEWLGFPIHAHGKVCYFQLDTPRSLWATRIEDLRNQGLDLVDLYWSDAELAPEMFDITKEDHRVWLKMQLAQIQPLVIFIDTIREFHRGDENDSKQMQNVMSSLALAARPAACVIISHAAKENMTIPEADRDNSFGDNRGSSYVQGRMDGTIKVIPSGFSYVSRTIEKGRIKAGRLRNGFWYLSDKEETHILEGLNDRSESLRGAAKELSEKIGITPEAARKRLQRARK